MKKQFVENGFSTSPAGIKEEFNARLLLSLESSKANESAFYFIFGNPSFEKLLFLSAVDIYIYIQNLIV